MIPVWTDLPDEVDVAPASLVFTVANYGTPQVVTVTGLDDADVDGTQGLRRRRGAGLVGRSGVRRAVRPRRARQQPRRRVAGRGDGAAVGAARGRGGSTDLLDVKLFTQPTADVVLTIAVSDDTEAELDLEELTFTPVDWDVPQTVTVTGLDDAEIDGDVAWTIDVVAASSGDPSYDDVTALQEVAAEGTTEDDDGPGYLVAPQAGLRTSESGGVADFTVALRTPPAGEVYVVVNSFDPSEGTASPTVLIFDAADYDVAQTVTVTGVDDAEQDGDVAYAVVLSATSTDPLYAAVDPPDVAVVNLDDDFGGTTTDTGTPPTDTTSTDTTTDPTTDTPGGGPGGETDKGGCGCATPAGPWGPWGVAWVVALAGVVVRRRREHSV
ncbi:MAG: MYXO-CTERM sorting domain-containing protein [Myxococcota bacterium]